MRHFTLTNAQHQSSLNFSSQDMTSSDSENNVQKLLKQKTLEQNVIPKFKSQNYQMTDSQKLSNKFQEDDLAEFNEENKDELESNHEFAQNDIQWS